MYRASLKKLPTITASVLFAGCVTMTPPELPASHPANPNAPQAQLVVRTEIERYQPSPPTEGKQDEMTGMHGMDHAAHGKAATSSTEVPAAQGAGPGSSMQHRDHADLGAAGNSKSADAHAAVAGTPATDDQAARTVKIIALDTMRFMPQTLEVKAGETIRFVVTNAGKLPHEFVVGNRREQQEHEAMMKKMRGMQHAHGNALTLTPGETKTLVWRFDQPGTYELACHIPGHYEAGMVSNVIVARDATGRQHSGGGPGDMPQMQDMPGMPVPMLPSH